MYEGYEAMFTGEPSKAAKETEDRGFGLVKGDGVGRVDTANTMGTGKVDEYGMADGKRKKVPSETEQS